MSRKDSKGRVLKAGESQRKDGSYQFRFTNEIGKRITVYAPTLDKLRNKEAEILKSKASGVDYSAGDITVLELVERSLSLKKGVRNNTTVAYNTAKKTIEKDPISKKLVRDVKTSDAKRWAIRCSEEGRSYATVNLIRSVLASAFNMAIEDDIVLKNPFRFKLSDYVKIDQVSRTALTPDQQTAWLKFLYCYDGVYRESIHRLGDICTILLQTGLRIGELCGLTFDDFDLVNNRISIERQMLKVNSEIHLGKTKSATGVRFIPISPVVRRIYGKLLAAKSTRKHETMIDGHIGFLFITQSGGRPLTPDVIREQMNKAEEIFNLEHPEMKMPRLTPHVFRHTYCTNLANSGIDIKSLQYLMGHSNASITFDVYAHSSYEKVAEVMEGIWKASNNG